MEIETFILLSKMKAASECEYRIPSPEIFRRYS
jgi:hypothetical protein